LGSPESIAKLPMNQAAINQFLQTTIICHAQITQSAVAFTSSGLSNYWSDTTSLQY